MVNIKDQTQKEEYKSFINGDYSFISGKRICQECGTEFEITADEVSYYYWHDFRLPKHCKECRKNKRS